MTWVDVSTLTAHHVLWQLIPTFRPEYAAASKSNVFCGSKGVKGHSWSFVGMAPIRAGIYDMDASTVYMLVVRSGFLPWLLNEFRLLSEKAIHRGRQHSRDQNIASNIVCQDVLSFRHCWVSMLSVS
jgi:hypothetical protein